MLPLFVILINLRIMKKIALLIALLTTAITLTFAQTGEITGIVTDEFTQEPVSFATISLEGTDIGLLTDENGKYTIKPLPSGEYTLLFSFPGYQGRKIQGINVTPDAIVSIDLKVSIDVMKIIDVTEYQDLIDMTVAGVVPVISNKDLMNAPVVEYVDAVSTVVGAYQADAGETPIFRGSREANTIFMFEGMRMRGNTYIPRSAVGNIQVISGGMPAKYGDSTGGIILINMRGYPVY